MNWGFFKKKKQTVSVYKCPECHSVMSLVIRTDKTLLGKMRVYSCSSCGAVLRADMVPPVVFAIETGKPIEIKQQVFNSLL